MPSQEIKYREVIVTERMKLLVVFGFFWFAPAAGAMCVFNDTEEEVHVSFECGETLNLGCQFYWNLEPGDGKCRPGTEGLLRVTEYAAREGCSTYVGAEGYVEIKAELGVARCMAYD